jgi:formylglycine-generating enzyme required for sulfatase activity
LAAVSVTAIVVFLNKTGYIRPIAKAAVATTEKDTPKPNDVVVSEADKTVDTQSTSQPPIATTEKDTPKTNNVVVSQADKTVDTQSTSQPPIATAEKDTPKTNNVVVSQADKTVDTQSTSQPPIATTEKDTPKTNNVVVSQADKTVDTQSTSQPPIATTEKDTPKTNNVVVSQADKTIDTQSTSQPPIATTEKDTPKPDTVVVSEADKTIDTQATAQVGDVETRSVGMKLVYIPAGSFMMGSSRPAAQLAEEYGKAERRFKGEFPQHEVRISKGFWMGQTEVTQGQYKSVMSAEPWSGKTYVQADANNPAVYVSWDEAVEFCSKLSQLEGMTYRLPTEAEWEYACRAGTTSRFSFGDVDSSLGDYAWYNDNADKAGQDYAHPVGRKKPNPWGLYDMHGNIFEWCSDYYDENYYSSSLSVDPNGPPLGTSRSLRGGSWDNDADYLRCSYRSGYRVKRGLLVGFRVVAEGRAASGVPGVSIAVKWLSAPPKTNDEVKGQEDAPIPVKVRTKDTAPEADKPVLVDTAQQDKGPAPEADKPVPVDTTQQDKGPVPEADKPVPVDTTQQDKGPAPEVDKPVPVDTTQQPKDSGTVATDRAQAYASGNVYDILEAAAIDARSGNAEQAQAALTSLLKNKGAAVLAGYELGLIHYENGEVEKAMPFFKNALSAAFPGPPSGKDEQTLTALLNQEADAARIRYELGLAYLSQGKQDQTAKLFRDSLSTISAKGATYIGVKKCKSCHFKQWNSWRKTKMAKAFESLRPGVKSDEKTKLKFDPAKDYTKDPACLTCHASGFGMPGGYVVPPDGDSKAQGQAADNAGVTCEGCHGPGSKSVEIQEDIKENKRPYKFAELQAVGFHRAGVRACRSCHNASDPGKEPGYHFPYEEKRKEGQHENIELKYRQD